MTREERQIKEAFIDGYLAAVTRHRFGGTDYGVADWTPEARRAWREDNTTNRTDVEASNA